MISTLIRIAATGLLALSLLIPYTTPAAGMSGTITGKVIDSVTGQGILDVHLYLGIPGAFIWAHSAADGTFTIDLTPVSYNPQTQWQVYFITNTSLHLPTNHFFMTFN